MSPKPFARAAAFWCSAVLLVPAARGQNQVQTGGPLGASTAQARARKAIQAAYDSPLFPRLSYTHFASLHWPSRYKVVRGSFQSTRAVEKLTLSAGGDRAAATVRYYESVRAVNPDTRRPVLFEAVDVQEDRWVKTKKGWAPKRGEVLSSTYLVDGKAPRFDP